jgi:hypothetical protein
MVIAASRSTMTTSTAAMGEEEDTSYGGSSSPYPSMTMMTTMPPPPISPLTPAGVAESAACNYYYRSFLPRCPDEEVEEEDSNDKKGDDEEGGGVSPCSSVGTRSNSNASTRTTFSFSSSSSSSITGATPDVLTFESLDDESDRQTRLVFQKYHGGAGKEGGGAKSASLPNAAASFFSRTLASKEVRLDSKAMSLPTLPTAAAAASYDDNIDDEENHGGSFCCAMGVTSLPPTPRMSAAAVNGAAVSEVAEVTAASRPVPVPSKGTDSKIEGQGTKTSMAEEQPPLTPKDLDSSHFCCSIGGAGEEQVPAVTSAADVEVLETAAAADNVAGRASTLSSTPPVRRRATSLMRMRKAPSTPTLVSEADGENDMKSPQQRELVFEAPPNKPLVVPTASSSTKLAMRAEDDDISADGGSNDDEDHDSGIILCFPRGTALSPSLMACGESYGDSSKKKIGPGESKMTEKSVGPQPARTSFFGVAPSSNMLETASMATTTYAPALSHTPTAKIAPLTRSASSKSAGILSRGLFRQQSSDEGKPDAEKMATTITTAVATIDTTTINDPYSPRMSPFDGDNQHEGDDTTPVLRPLNGPAAVLMLKQQVTSAVDAIDQTVEAIIGLCLPPLMDSSMILEASEDNDLLASNTDYGMMPENRNRASSASHGDPNGVEGLTPTYFQMAPKVEVTTAHHGGSRDDEDGSTASKYARLQQQFIVCSTTEQLDDIRVVTIVGRDGVPVQDRSRRRSKAMFPRKVRGKIRKWLVPGSGGGEGSSARSFMGSQTSPARHSIRSSVNSTGAINLRVRRKLKAMKIGSSRLLMLSRSLAREVRANEDASSSSADEDLLSMYSRSTLSSNAYPDGGASVRSFTELPRRRRGFHLLSWANPNSKNDAGGEEEDLGSCSLCSMSSSFGSLATHNSWMSYLSLPWFWSLVLGPGGLERELSPSGGQGDFEIDLESHRGLDRKPSKQGDSRRAGMQLFAPVHVVKNAMLFDEAPPPSTSPRGHKPDGAPEDFSSEIATTLSHIHSVTRSISSSFGFGPTIADQGTKYVTEDEKTITDCDSSVHTIRILRIPTENLMVQPLPSPPEEKYSKSSLPEVSTGKYKTLASRSTRPQDGSPRAPLSPLSATSWHPGMSARSRSVSPVLPSARKSGSCRAPLKSLADDLSHHGSTSSVVSMPSKRDPASAIRRRVLSIHHPKLPSRRHFSSRTADPSSSKLRVPLLPIAPPPPEYLYQMQDETTTVNYDNETQSLTTTIRIRRVPSELTE